ncbi:MAG: PQQ-binding-like beta-propeller repeat protein [Thermomicrobiales bacterium]
MTALEAATGTSGGPLRFRPRARICLPHARTPSSSSGVTSMLPALPRRQRAMVFDISALAAATGESRWSFRPRREDVLRPCYAQQCTRRDRHALPSEEHSAICAIASDTGAEVWRHPLAPGETAATEIMTLAADDGDHVVAGDGMATALNAASGEEQRGGYGRSRA